MTLNKIAKLAGVSKSTVSRVMNNDPHVSSRTRAKVQAVIDAEQYQLNPAARALASRQTRILGVVISNNIGVLFDTSFYFPTILRGISSATHDRDYAMLLMIGDDNEDDIRFTRRIVNNQIMDGIVLVSPAIGHPLIEELITEGIPFVSADRIPGHDDVSFVTVENIESSKVAVTHLIKQGRRRIAMIAGDSHIIDSLDRIEGYKLALQDANIPFDPDLVVNSRYSYQASYDAIQKLLHDNVDFDGVYASQSTIATGAVNSLFDAGINIPDEVALISFDDLADAINPQIAISTMRQPVFEKGYQLATTLIDIVEGKNTPPIQHFLPTELVIRATCGGMK